MDDFLLLGKDRKVLKRMKLKITGRFSMPNTGDVSLVLGMEVIPDRTKGTVTTVQEINSCAMSFLARYGMANCNPTYTLGARKQLALDQP